MDKDAAEAIFAGAGEMRSLMREKDWSITPLGPVDRWPALLLSTLRICLSAGFPMAIYWGDKGHLLYNDAWRPILGRKHPWGLGRPADEVWPEIWDAIAPLFESVRSTGEATWRGDELLAMHRFGYTEECYFDYTFNPIRREDGRVEGILNVVQETTYRVLNDRRQRLLHELASHSGSGKSETDACDMTMSAIATDRADIPFALMYLLQPDGTKAHLAAATGLTDDSPARVSEIDLTEDNGSIWPLALVCREGRSLTVDLSDRFGVLANGHWQEPTTQAIVLPVPSAGQGSLAGMLVAGVNPRRPLDDEYRHFFDMVASQIAAAITNAKAYAFEKRRAEALAELDRAKTDFFSNVSHEFRTPLTLMLGPVENLLMQCHGDLPAPIKEELHVVNRNGLRLLRLVNSLLDFSRLEAGRVRARFEPTDLAQFTAELASMFQSAAARAGLRLVVDCPPLPELVYVDHDMWEKTVLNLLSNAFKFTFTGEIAVTLRVVTAGSRMVHLSVRDTGIGIASEELPRVFERFYRVEGARGRTHEGTGIGLALVQELVKLHGGVIEAQSTLGEGSTFTVRVPLGTAHLPVDRIGQGSPPTVSAAKAAPFVEEALRWISDEESAELQVLSSELNLEMLGTQDSALSTEQPRSHVLIVDDNADMRGYLCRLLQEHYEVTTAADGEAALAAARRHRPDLILTDVMMPRLDGFGLVRELRDDPFLKTIPIIVLSARAGEESRVEGLDRGADDYLVKPFSARELLARLAAHLDMARLHREAREAADKANARLAAIVESSDDAIVGKDLNGIITSWNAGAEQLFGYTAQEAVGRSITMLMPPDRVHEEAGILNRIRRGERIHHYETVRRRKDGVLLDISLTISPIRNASGAIVGASKIARNITERKRQEADLAARERQQRLLYELATAVNRAEALTDLYDKALDAIMRSLNADRASILLFDDAGVMRFTAWRGLSEEYRRAVEGHSPWQRDTLDADAIVVGNVAETEMPGDLRAAIRREGIGALGFIPLTYGGRLLGKVMVYFDRPHTMQEEEIRLALAIAGTLALGIERRRSEEALRRLADELELRVEERTRELNRSRERLRALASELNLAEQRERRRLATDLHDYLAQLLALSKIKVAQVKQRPEPRFVAKGLNEIQEIIDQALMYTRTLVAQLTPPVLREFGLLSALTWLSEQMKARNLTVSLNVEHEIGVLPEDQAMLLFYSVRELLINVAKHGQTDRAMVTVGLADGMLRVAVDDKGIGFDLAGAADKAVSSPPKFGLFSIRERMKALGGEFHIASSPGQGTTATLVLPLTPQTTETPAANETSEMVHEESATPTTVNVELETRDVRLSHHAPGTELQRSAEARHRVPHDTASNSEFRTHDSEFQQHARVRVLLVDDHAMVRQGLRGLLEGYADLQVIGEAGNGEDAVSMGMQLRPHVVLMDVNMPKMDGIEAARRLRQSHPQMVIIGLSVDNSRHIEMAMREAGAAAFHTKEAAVEELYLSIQAALGKNRAG